MLFFTKAMNIGLNNAHFSFSSFFLYTFKKLYFFKECHDKHTSAKNTYKADEKAKQLLSLQTSVMNGELNKFKIIVMNYEKMVTHNILMKEGQHYFCCLVVRVSGYWSRRSLV